MHARALFELSNSISYIFRKFGHESVGEAIRDNQVW